ncbi:MAG: hypothetical protein HOQ09_03870 [Gemmatimonadaceae bacterium]|nr:hypothetical protein [Gemmatimonadaceae bacterium]
MIRIRLDRSRAALRPLLAICLFASGLAAQSSSGARLVVSRRDARVTFPRDTAQRWGWTPADTTGAWTYLWSLHTPAVEGSSSVELAVGRAPDDTLRRFRSLRAVVASGRVMRCGGESWVQLCDERDVGKAAVRDGAVEITLRDSALVANLFGLRPARAELAFGRPGLATTWSDSVSVEYVDPQMPPPSDSLLAWVAERKRLARKNGRWVSRSISVRPGWSGWDSSWVTVGDTLELRLSEETCSGDLCAGSWDAPKSDSSFVISDTTVLGALPKRVAPPRPPASAGVAVLEEMVIVAPGVPGPITRIARRPGVSTVHVGGLAPYADTAHVCEAPRTSLTQVVVVRPPVARVVIHPRPDTIRAGAEPRFTADVFDAAGGLLPHASVDITYPDADLRPHPRRYESPLDPLPPGGRRRVVATFRGKADTLSVFVADSMKR